MISPAIFLRKKQAKIDDAFSNSPTIDFKWPGETTSLS